MAFAKVNGINVNYRVEGQGQPLVMVAGLAMNLSGWQPQLAVFKKQYRIITFDNRGIGKSDKPKGPYPPKIMAEDTVQLMDHLNIKEAHILGVSMGGLIAQEIAIRHPARVVKLILVSTWSYQDNYNNGITSAMLEAAKLPIRQGATLLVDASMDKLFNRLFILPTLKVQCKSMKKPEATGIEGQRDGVMDYSSLNRLRLIKAPTLVIAGTKDRVIKHTSSETIAKNIPNARLVKIKDGSHSVFAEMSKVFNKAVQDFLKTD
jgi:pimeloyl-ACP methyl ester carboxylesterase